MALRGLRRDGGETNTEGEEEEERLVLSLFPSDKTE